MKRFDRAFSSASRRVATAAAWTIRDFGSGALPDEPSITAALVTRVRDTLDGLQTPGVAWTARILSSHGPNTEEARYGADFLGVLSLSLPDYSINKRFLAQAKRQEPGKRLSAAEWTRLKQQCEEMLARTSESFVLAYARNGVFVVPAISVTACSNPEDLHTLHPKPLGRFYRDQFECWVGQRMPDTDSAMRLDNFGFSKGLEIAGKTEGQE